MFEPCGKLQEPSPVSFGKTSHKHPTDQGSDN
jgi:hypothetical protein